MFIDELFGKDFYKQLGLDYSKTFKFGQFYWTHAYYPHENLQYWRPVVFPFAYAKSIATQFEIQEKQVDEFNKGYVLSSPKLERNEELLVIRAKVRPVVLIQPEINIPEHFQKGYRGKLNRHRCLVAQVYGLADTKTGRAEFDPSFINRVRQMEFPQFMFLPQKAGLLEVDSLLRLDELQSVFVSHLNARQFSLGDEITDLLKAQLTWLITGEQSENYKYYREEMLNN